MIKVATTIFCALALTTPGAMAQPPCIPVAIDGPKVYWAGIATSAEVSTGDIIIEPASVVPATAFPVKIVDSNGTEACVVRVRVRNAAATRPDFELVVGSSIN